MSNFIAASNTNWYKLAKARREDMSWYKKAKTDKKAQAAPAAPTKTPGKTTPTKDPGKKISPFKAPNPAVKPDPKARKKDEKNIKRSI